MNFLIWLGRAFEDSVNHNPSIKRISLLTTVVALSIAEIILALAAFMGKSVGVEIGTVSGSLAAVGGGSYVGGKAIERAVPPKSQEAPSP